MSKTTELVTLLRQTADLVERQGQSGDLYRAAAREIERMDNAIVIARAMLNYDHDNKTYGKRTATYDAAPKTVIPLDDALWEKPGVVAISVQRTEEE